MLIILIEIDCKLRLIIIDWKIIGNKNWLLLISY